MSLLEYVPVPPSTAYAYAPNSPFAYSPGSPSTLVASNRASFETPTGVSPNALPSIGLSAPLVEARSPVLMAAPAGQVLGQYSPGQYSPGQYQYAAEPVNFGASSSLSLNSVMAAPVNTTTQQELARWGSLGYGPGLGASKLVVSPVQPMGYPISIPSLPSSPSLSPPVLSPPVLSPPQWSPALTSSPCEAPMVRLPRELKTNMLSHDEVQAQGVSRRSMIMNFYSEVDGEFGIGIAFENEAELRSYLTTSEFDLASEHPIAARYIHYVDVARYRPYSVKYGKLLPLVGDGSLVGAKVTYFRLTLGKHGKVVLAVIIE